ncbi:hypothetical protein ASD56_11305 [Microbacterium sp. Root166]|uniref:hypothetical protein n=1 Tax=Microbacterium sp. Root166 TaxID=1736478 RepID=UPI0006F94A01|nr:hypothetical protein [Microbacterium sp. Root166]KQZ84528.1 hypothetical protein ASD56_11305 [Microbacterium sp. Root166]
MEPIPPERRVIRLFPDHGHPWPLWENSTPTWEVGYTTSPDMYGLSAELTEDLSGWYAFWLQHRDPFEGGDAEENRARWFRDRDRIAGRLREEVAAFADVILE